MPRSDFTERQYTCVLCGEDYIALSGATPVLDPVCMSCGLRSGPEKLKQLIDGRKKKRANR